MISKRVRNNFTKLYFDLPIEAFIWIAGLVLLMIFNPVEDKHMSICLFSHLGFKFCPGCGLGRSVSYLLHGDFVRSIQIHPLGIFTLLILMHRIYYLIKKFITRTLINKNYHG